MWRGPVAALAIAGIAAGCGEVIAPGASGSASGSGSGGVGGNSGGAASVGGAGMGGASTAGMGGIGGTTCAPGAMIACYSGPDGTQGVGVCHGGHQTCKADGSDYGPCEGEVIPAAEDCQTAADENCNAAPIDGCGEYLWSKAFAGGLANVPRPVVTDSAGNVIVAGTFQGSITLGGPILVGDGSEPDVFVGALDANGNHLSSMRFGNENPEYVTGVAVDPAGNVVVTGLFGGSISLGNGVTLMAPPPFYSTFVVKLDPAGTPLWALQYSTASARSVAIDAAGHIIVAGDFFGTVDFGGGPVSAFEANDLFVLKLETNGAFIWSKRFGVQGDQMAADVAVDSLGNVIFTGSFGGGVDFGGGILAAAGASDVFVAKLNHLGDHVFSRRFGDGSIQTGSAVAVTGAGEVIVTGTFDGTIDLGGGPLQSAGQDIFLGKLDGFGNHVWSKHFGMAGVQVPSSVAAFADGRVTLVGRSDGSVDFGGGVLTSVGQSDAFVARFDAAGDHVWSRRYGSSLEDAAGVALDAAGNAFVIGNYDSCVAMDLGGGPICNMSPKPNGAFLAKFAP